MKDEIGGEKTLEYVHTPIWLVDSEMNLMKPATLTDALDFGIDCMGNLRSLDDYVGQNRFKEKIFAVIL